MSILSVIRVAFTRWSLPKSSGDRRRLRRCTLCQDRISAGILVERVGVNYDWRIMFCETCARRLAEEAEKIKNATRR